MRKLLITSTILIACFTCSKVYAQAQLPEFGKVDTADLLMKDCDFDKGADAMNLVKYENAEFQITQNGLYVDVTRWARIKIFRQSGFAHASVVIPFIRKDKLIKIMDITAFAYSIDSFGNITTEKLRKKDIYEEESKTGMGSIRFTFSNIKEGNVIEYKYVLEEDNLLYLDPWLFQDVIPTRLSLCNLKYNSFVDINIGVHTSLPFTSNPDSVRAMDGHYKKIVQSYSMADVPAFRAEPMMSSLNDNLQRIVFSILPGTGTKPARSAVPAEEKWRIYNLQLLFSYSFGLQLSRPIAGTEQKLDSITHLTISGEKINAVYEWVKKTVKWDSTRSILAGDLAAVWNDKAGNNAEINLLILNFLRKVGIRCYPMLTSTRAHGKPDIDFANLGQFNGVAILALDSTGRFVLDGTQKYQLYNIPPYNVLNSYAFIVDGSSNHWFYIKDDRQLTKNTIDIDAAINNSGTISGKVVVSYYDYAKVDVLTASREDKETGSRDLLGDDFSLKIDSIKDENIDDPRKPLIRSFNFKTEMQQTGNYYFLDPYFLSPFKKNPFVDSVRRTKVDFGSNQYYGINMRITLPAGIEISDLPGKSEIHTADSSFLFGREVVGDANNIVVKSHFDVLKPIFTVEDYPFLKAAFDKMYSLLNERVVFKKKG